MNRYFMYVPAHFEQVCKDPQSDEQIVPTQHNLRCPNLNQLEDCSKEDDKAAAGEGVN